MRSTVCTQFASHVIAATAIYLAGRYLKKALPQDWWKLCETSFEEIEDCALQILSVYDVKSVYVCLAPKTEEQDTSKSKVEEIRKRIKTKHDNN